MVSMGIISILVDQTNDRKKRVPAFCKCYSDKYSKNRFIPANDVQITCTCGEESCNIIEWIWDKNKRHPESVLNDGHVTFHPIYSQGTSIIVGDTPLQSGYHHYWEVKMLSQVSGTDIMIGIGTDKVDLVSYQYKFASAIGIDNQSWGFSYRGVTQHDGKSKYYGKKFTQGSIVGVHFDSYRGKVEYYINRRPQGLAFKNIPVNDKTKLYPMVSSTAAKSSMKLINSSSFPEGLVYLCMKVLSRYPSMVKELDRYPGIKHYKTDLFYLQTPEKYQYSTDRDESVDNDDFVVISSNKKSRIEETKTDDETDDVSGVYDKMQITLANKCPLDVSDEDDDDENPSFLSFFCNHFDFYYFMLLYYIFS